MDKVDRAQEYMERQDIERLARIRRQVSCTAESSEFCVECGEVIPDERRHAVRGVDTCVHCRTLQEKQVA